ncbi:hypothetical protein ACFE04_027179 [Oxalis oulophora]
MAYSLTTPLILLAIFSLIYPALGVSQKALTNICSKTKTPDACVKYLNSDPTTATVELPQLLSLSISSTQRSSQAFLKMFTDIKDNSTRLELKKAAIIGLKYYEAIGEKLNQAYKMSESKQYKPSALVMAKALDLISKCGVEINAKSEMFKTFNNVMYFKSEVAHQIGVYIC